MSERAMIDEAKAREILAQTVLDKIPPQCACDECKGLSRAARIIRDADLSPARGGEDAEAKRCPDPWITLLADWERENGTIAGIMPAEYENLMESVRRLAITHSPRQAETAAKVEGGEGMRAFVENATKAIVDQAQQIADLKDELAACREQAIDAARYHELLFAVGNKYPGETRHQTALRYIRQMEDASDLLGQMVKEDAARKP